MIRRERGGLVVTALPVPSGGGQSDPGFVPRALELKPGVWLRSRAAVPKWMWKGRCARTQGCWDRQPMIKYRCSNIDDRLSMIDD